MKKTLRYFSAGSLIIICLAFFWAFRSTNDATTSSYASVNYIAAPANRYAIFAYPDGNPEEVKFDKGLSDPQVIVQITAKLEAKGYTLEQYAVSGTGHYFIFHKKS